MPGKKTRQDGISTARKKWAIRDQLAAAPTDRRNGHRRDRPNRSALSALDIDGEPKGYIFLLHRLMNVISPAALIFRR
jgi:hypothetical protein